MVRIDRIEIRFPLVEERDTAIRACARLESELSEARRQLAEARLEIAAGDIGSAYMRADRDAARRQLEEARKVVWLLLAWLRVGGGRAEAMYGGMGARERAAWGAMPRWLRREIER